MKPKDLLLVCLLLASTAHAHFEFIDQYFTSNLLSPVGYYGPFADYTQCKFYMHGLYFDLNASQAIVEGFMMQTKWIKSDEETQKFIQEYKTKYDGAFMQYMINDLAAMNPEDLKKYLGDVLIDSKTFREKKEAATPAAPAIEANSGGNSSSANSVTPVNTTRATPPPPVKKRYGVYFNICKYPLNLTQEAITSGRFPKAADRRIFTDPSCKDAASSLSFLVNLEYDPAQAVAFPLCIGLTNNTMRAGVNKTFDQLDYKRKKNSITIFYKQH